MDYFLNISQDVGVVRLRSHDPHVMPSLLWVSLLDKLWIKSETEVVVTHSHLEIPNANQVTDSLWDWNRRHAIRMEFVGPRNDHVESIVEEVSNSFVGVRSLQVLYEVRLDLGPLHLNGVPVGQHVHVLKPHVEIDEYVVILNSQEHFLEVFVPNFGFHAELYLHLLFIEDEARCTQVLDASAQRHIITNVRCEIWHKVL